jgi:hypothetical protein
MVAPRVVVDRAATRARVDPAATLDRSARREPVEQGVTRARREPEAQGETRAPQASEGTPARAAARATMLATTPHRATEARPVQAGTMRAGARVLLVIPPAVVVVETAEA